MMAKRIVITDNAPKSIAYSQGVKAVGFVFVAGQGPFDSNTGEVVGATIQEQTAQCLKNIEAILHAAGSSLDRIVRQYAAATTVRRPGSLPMLRHHRVSVRQST
jgi:2-iminobutanoate/2-iminopropanoate deaminase